MKKIILMAILIIIGNSGLSETIDDCEQLKPEYYKASIINNYDGSIMIFNPQLSFNGKYAYIHVTDGEITAAIGLCSLFCKNEFLDSSNKKA